MNESVTKIVARRRIEDFRQQHPALMNLACYAALPVALTSELVHLLRINLCQEPAVDYTAETDLLISRLCYEIGSDLYEFDPDVRETLLAELWNQPDGQEHLRQAAALLWKYSQRSPGPWTDRERLRWAQELTAASFFDPARAETWYNQAKKVPSGLPTTLDHAWFAAMLQEVERPERLEKDKQVSALLRQATHAEQQAELEQTRNFYLQVLELDPQNSDAQAGLQRVMAGLKIEIRILQLIQSGNTQQRGGDYEKAEATFIEALRLANESGRQTYRFELEQKCELVRKLADWQQQIQKTLAQVDNLTQERKVEQAYELLTRLLNDFPQDPVYADMRVQLQQVRQSLEYHLDWLEGYSYTQFFNREEEIRHITKKVEQLRINSTLEQRVVIFTGPRGIGKTWLLKYLYTRLRSLPGVIVSPLDLTRYRGEDPKQDLKAILEDFGRDIKLPRLSGEGVKEQARNLIEKLPSSPLVLLIDSVYETNYQLLELLEDYLLAPLASLLNVLIVMAGRGQPYAWKNPGFKLFTEIISLEPFDERITAEQLDKLPARNNPLSASDIYAITRGNPLASRLLSEAADPAQALNQIVAQMLGVVPAVSPGEKEPIHIIKELLAGTPGNNQRTVRDYVRDCLEALCILRFFEDDERIGKLLEVYYKTEQLSRHWQDMQVQQIQSRLNEWDFAEFRKVTQGLVRYRLAQFNKSQEGFIMDQSLRQLIEHYLRQSKPDLWRNLHAAARELYTEWYREYHQGRWSIEAEYHAGQAQTSSMRSS